VTLSGSTRRLALAGTLIVLVALGASAPAMAAVPTLSGAAPSTTVSDAGVDSAGAPRWGSLLTASDGSWDDPLATFTYQWQLCTDRTDPSTCGDVAGETTRTLRIPVDGIGKAYRVGVTATNGDGPSTVAYSAITATVLKGGCIDYSGRSWLGPIVLDDDGFVIGCDESKQSADLIAASRSGSEEDALSGNAYWEDRLGYECDDCYSNELPIGFTIDYFGQEFSTVFVNSNGSISFGDGSEDYDDPLEEIMGNAVGVCAFCLDLEPEMVAGSVPWGAVDRHAEFVYWGRTTYDGEQAFVATWINSPTYEQENPFTTHDKLTSFQIMLVDRGAGTDVDIIVNYGSVLGLTDGWYGSNSAGTDCSIADDDEQPYGCVAIGLGTVEIDDDGNTVLDGNGDPYVVYASIQDDDDFEFNGLPLADVRDGGSSPVSASKLNTTVTGRYQFEMRGGRLPEAQGTNPTFVAIPTPTTSPAPAASPVPDPEGGLPVVTPPGSTSGSVGGVPTAPTPSVPTSGTAKYEVGDVQAEVRTSGAGTVSGPSSAPVLQVVRDRVATVGGGGMAPGGIVEVWMPLPGGGSRQVALLPVAPDGTFDGALPFTGELDGRGPLPIGERTIQLFGTDANGQLTVINVGIRVQQPGPLAPEPERTPGAPPSLAPGQSLATNAGIPTPVTVTPQPGSRRVGVAGDGWLLEIDVPEGTVRDEAGNPIMEIITGDDTEVRGTGFLPGTRAYVWIMSTPKFLGEVTVRSDGSFAGDLPVDVAPGQHTLQVSGVGTDGYIRAANLGVTVLAGDGNPRPNRVRAGEGTAPLLPLETGALALSLAAGLAAADRTRRRSRSTAD
jgi:hypothetical protein